MVVTIENLPTELRSQIFQDLSHADRLTLRLTSRKLLGDANPLVFQEFVLKLTPGDTSSQSVATEAMNNILDRPDLCQHVRHFYFDTGSRQKLPIRTKDNTLTLGLSRALEVALSRISHFEELRSILLRFRGKYCLRDGMCYRNRLLNHPESVGFRAQVLSLIINSLNDDAHPVPHFKHLAIQGLQNYRDPALTTSKQFLSVLARLDSLKLSFTVDALAIGQDFIVNIPELHDSYRQLPSVWLQPLTANLASLYLIAGRGTFNRTLCLDLRGIRFPALRMMALGDCCFAYEWQLAWIVKHASTLEALMMDGCLIDYLPHESRGYPFDPAIPRNTRIKVGWSSFFRTLAGGFPRLAEFQFGLSEERSADCRAFDDIHTLKSALYHSMYMPASPMAQFGGEDDDVIVQRPDRTEDEEVLGDLQSMLQQRRRTESIRQDVMCAG